VAAIHGSPVAPETLIKTRGPKQVSGSEIFCLIRASPLLLNLTELVLEKTLTPHTRLASTCFTGPVVPSRDVPVPVINRLRKFTYKVPLRKISTRPEGSVHGTPPLGTLAMVLLGEDPASVAMKIGRDPLESTTAGFAAAKTVKFARSADPTTSIRTTDRMVTVVNFFIASLTDV
jgi:hypothetical protein